MRCSPLFILESAIPSINRYNVSHSISPPINEHPEVHGMCFYWNTKKTVLRVGGKLLYLGFVILKTNQNTMDVQMSGRILRQGAEKSKYGELKVSCLKTKNL